MELEQSHLFAIGVLLAWLAGVRVYLTVFGVGLAGALGWLQLPDALQATQSMWVLGTSGALAAAEFFADKIPGVDSVWDALQSVIRVPAGAALAAGVFGADNASMAVAAGLLGGTLSATSLATKMTTRAAANTSPEPFSNWGLSFLEDGLVVGTVWLATQHPIAFGFALVFALILSVIVLIVLFKFLRAVWRRISGLFSDSERKVV